MYNRISIVGGSGSGKTTLCNILSKELNLPAIHLDGINFKPNWVERDKAERDTIIANKVFDDKWIIDGNYTKTIKERLDRADLIIWLDYSTFALVKGVFKRMLKNFKSERTEISGCKERFNFKFMKYVIFYNKCSRSKLTNNLDTIPKEKILRFKKQKDLNKWLKDFTHNENILDAIK